MDNEKCFYRNFIKETGGAAPANPVIFLKPSSSLILATGDLNKDVVLVSSSR